jgi:hypothetical protein
MLFDHPTHTQALHDFRANPNDLHAPLREQSNRSPKFYVKEVIFTTEEKKREPGTERLPLCSRFPLLIFPKANTLSASPRWPLQK